MATFRAAYIADDGTSTSGGFLLTEEDQQHLSDADLLATAEAVKKECGAVGEIVIGEWRD